MWRNSKKALQDVLSITWKMHHASEKLNRKKTRSMDVFRKCANGECVDDCNGTWLECALEVLTNNRIHPIVFGPATRELLEKGRGKF